MKLVTDASGRVIEAGSQIGVEVAATRGLTVEADDRRPVGWLRHRPFGVDIAFRIEVVPGALDPVLSRRLIEEGIYPSSFSAIMVGQPSLVRGATSARVGMVELSVGDGRFWPLYQECFEDAPLTDEQQDRAIHAWREHEGRLSCWLASVGDTPVGVAILYLMEPAPIPGVRRRTRSRPRSTN